jgi:putative ABC transport system permease protein
VLSDRLWRLRFGADSSIIGRAVTLDGVERTVVGVMPPGFDYPEGAQLWTSLRFTDDMLAPGERGDRYLRVVGRLRPDVHPAALGGRLERLVPTFRHGHPEYYVDPDFRLTAVTLRESLLGDVRPAFLALLAGVALVLLIMLGNLTNVSLARATVRTREMALRSSLGARRSRLVRQMTLETLLMGLLGGVGGAALGWWGVRLLAALSPAGLPRLADVRPDWRVLAFGLTVSLIAGVVGGAIPAVLGLARRRGGELRSSGVRASEEARGRHVRDALVAAQVAVTVLLLVGAGLLVRSLSRLDSVDPGLDPSRTLTARVGLPSSSYAAPSRVRAFYDHLLDEVRSIPGVRSAGATAILPLDDGGWEVSFQVEGRALAPGAPQPSVQYRPVTPGFFETLRIPLLRGRRLAAGDGPEAPFVAVANQAFVRRFLAEGNALGARIRLPRLGASTEHVRSVVGIVGDVHESLDRNAPPILYVPHAQQPSRTMTLVLRSDGPPTTLISAVRSRLARLDPSLPLYDVRSMDRVVGAKLARPRFVSFLLGLFSVAGLALACLGVWAVVSYNVARRTREVGIRMALGATPRSVVAALGRRGLAPVLLGILAGLIASVPTTRLLRSLVFGVSAHDPGTLLVACTIILVIGAASAWLPARRAASVDPVAALREE